MHDCERVPDFLEKRTHQTNEPRPNVQVECTRSLSPARRDDDDGMEVHGCRSAPLGDEHDPGNASLGGVAPEILGDRPARLLAPDQI